jgi:hypothetical protein
VNGFTHAKKNLLRAEIEAVLTKFARGLSI